MSEQKSPLINLAASIAATITCCTSDVKEQNTSVNVDRASRVNGADLDAMPVIKSNSVVSQDLTPIVEIPEKIKEGVLHDE
jgi:glutamate mutase epsilon subunit